MDEILASIRRIIENGEERGTGRRLSERKPSAAAVPSSGPVDELPAAAAMRPVVPQLGIHYFPDLKRTEPQSLPAALAVGEPDEPVLDEKAAEAGGDFVSLEGDWSLLRPGTDALAGNGPPLRRALSEPDVEPSFPDIAGAPPAENENTTPARTRSLPEFSFEFDDEAFEAELHGEALSAPRPAGGSRSEAPIPESVIDGASALLSAEAGDQVAAAFDDLARTIRDGQMRSMEEMAREMMRPMMQEWMDDNLPRIVERLVREEIERIARGPRR